MALPYRIQDRDLILTASFGSSIYPVHGEEAETLMQSADKALYEAKRNGKNDYLIAAQSGLLVKSHC
jgi:diguanylate cyclase (GGDEF)-like protein